MTDRTVLVIGVGNELRGDDGAGIAVARRLRQAATRSLIEVREHQGEPTALLGTWQGYHAVVLIDTMRSDAAPGTIRRFDVSSEPLPARLEGSSSTHALALEDAVELARGLRRLPGRVIVYAVEGRTFEAGAGLSEQLEVSVPALADAVMREATELAEGP